MGYVNSLEGIVRHYKDPAMNQPGFHGSWQPVVASSVAGPTIEVLRPRIAEHAVNGGSDPVISLGRSLGCGDFAAEKFTWQRNVSILCFKSSGHKKDVCR